MVFLKFSPQQDSLAVFLHPENQEHDAQTHQKVREIDGELPGLANLGNTCFANSVLQCLLNTPGWFAEAFLAFRSCDGLELSQKARLGRSFATLAKEYGLSAGKPLSRTNSALVSMKDSIAALDHKYAGCQQQDAYEFLGCLLEGLDESFGALYNRFETGGPTPTKTPTAGVIRAICGVTTHTRRACHVCSGIFEVDKVTDTAIRLPLISAGAQFDPSVRTQEERCPVTLQELMDTAREPEIIEGYDCDSCKECAARNGREHVRSKITQHAGVISATRDVLVVVLYRFGQALDAAGNFKPVKVNRQVACPMELAMETGTYRLFGVVSHRGDSLSAGHYVAAVRSRRDGMWYECDDEKVTPLHLKALYDGRSITAVRDGLVPYILFYHRKQAESLKHPCEEKSPEVCTATALAGESGDPSPISDLAAQPDTLVDDAAARDAMAFANEGPVSHTLPTVCDAVSAAIDMCADGCSASVADGPRTSSVDVCMGGNGGAAVAQSDSCYDALNDSDWTIISFADVDEERQAGLGSPAAGGDRLVSSDCHASMVAFEQGEDRCTRRRLLDGESATESTDGQIPSSTPLATAQQALKHSSVGGGRPTPVGRLLNSDSPCSGLAHALHRGYLSFARLA